MSTPEHPVFTRRGDARAEVDEVVHQLEEQYGSAQPVGFVKYLYATKADQTVVLVTSRNAPLAAALRARPGWLEPGTA